MLAVQKRLLIFCSVPIVLVGNKTDLHMERMISSEEEKRLADSWKAAFLETSAKQNEVWLCNFSLLSDYSLSISRSRVRIEGSDHNDQHFLGCGVM
jgi:GTPase SAR1 family protein